MSMTLSHTHLARLSIASRIFLAIFGSYAVAVGADLACLALPIDKLEAIYWGQIISMLVCAAVIILVFSVKTATRAWLYVLGMAAVLFGVWYVFGPSTSTSINN